MDLENPLKYFTLFFGVQEVLGALIVFGVLMWMIIFRGSFAWQSKPDLQFNWHPLLLTIGMIYLYANAILIYRAFRNTRKKKLKTAHSLIQVTAFILTVIGLKAVFDSHNLADKPIPNMYSLHSWIGLTAVILFSCQWLAGFIAFLFPTLNGPLRASYLPVHVFFGILGFVLAVSAALLGLTEKAIFSNINYSNFSSEGVLINFIGVGLVIFASLVIYLVTETKFKRLPLPEDELLLTPTLSSLSASTASPVPEVINLQNMASS